MTDEEKQAIEKLHNGKKMDLINIIRTFKREGIEKFVVTKKETVETVLNLIEKQQAELEKEKKKSMHYEKLITNGLASKEIAKIDEEMQAVLRAEIEKKDKIIALMAEQLTTPIHSKEWVIEYYTKKVEMEDK